ncbi:MAG: hypothetical protein CMK92_03800 [Pseudomonas sp.]|nr:hypothetical protein [Pseudomonas sp.]
MPKLSKQKLRDMRRRKRNRQGKELAKLYVDKAVDACYAAANAMGSKFCDVDVAEQDYDYLWYIIREIQKNISYVSVTSNVNIDRSKFIRVSWMSDNSETSDGSDDDIEDTSDNDDEPPAKRQRRW